MNESSLARRIVMFPLVRIILAVAPIVLFLIGTSIATSKIPSRSLGAAIVPVFWKARFRPLNGSPILSTMSPVWSGGMVLRIACSMSSNLAAVSSMRVPVGTRTWMIICPASTLGKKFSPRNPTRSCKDRPRRSTDQAATTSNSRRAIPLHRRSNAGRLSRCLEPLIPSSANVATTSQP